MNSLILWVISTILDSVSTSTYKKSLSMWNMSKIMFKFLAYMYWAIIYLCLFIYLWIDKWIIYDPIYILFIFLICFFHIWLSMLWLHIYKNAKLSLLLPYNNLDKLFIIIIWFFLYSWIEWKEVSIITMIISIITVVITWLISVDFKSIKLPKIVLLHILNKFLHAIMVIWVWIIVLKYSSTTYLTFKYIFEILLYVMIAIALRDSFKTLFNQSRQFYKYRIVTTAMGLTWFILWIFIIEKAWVVIASLLWFLGIVFNILSMKIILKDTPSKKQIFLAIFVLVMIWIWYTLR